MQDAITCPWVDCDLKLILNIAQLSKDMRAGKGGKKISETVYALLITDMYIC